MEVRSGFTVFKPPPEGPKPSFQSELHTCIGIGHSSSGLHRSYFWGIWPRACLDVD